MQFWNWILDNLSLPPETPSHDINIMISILRATPSALSIVLTLGSPVTRWWSKYWDKNFQTSTKQSLTSADRILQSCDLSFSHCNQTFLIIYLTEMCNNKGKLENMIPQQFLNWKVTVGLNFSLWNWNWAFVYLSAQFSSVSSQLHGLQRV